MRKIHSSRSQIPLLILLVLLTGCGNPQNVSGVFGAEVGPVNIGLSIDQEGHVSIRGGFTKLSWKLGPVGLYAGIEDTLEFTKEKPYYLFIIYEDQNGEVYRDGYEIGKTFRVEFNQREYIEEIQGNNDSIIVVLKQALNVSNIRESSDTNFIPLSQITRTPEIYFPFPSEPKCAPSRLTVGNKAFVAPVAKSLYVRCYSDTHPSDNILYKIYPTQGVEIIGGPICNWGWILWQIPCDEYIQWRPANCHETITCWIAETDKGDEFWLEPINP